MKDPVENACDPASKAMMDLDSPDRLAKWAGALGVTQEALQAAVKAVGPRVDRVKDYLTGGAAGKQEDG
ncbi:MAG TPA: DUF3606 domain-containing protein [Burkholderiaceae bacterium]|nr:DUF3606 domain-containing protein [Burkholderiaceae bacterium]